MSSLKPNTPHFSVHANAHQQLRRTKFIATFMLILMGAVFIISRFIESQYYWVTYVTAFAEASLIGGLADWFAITALFRHPMSIPLPHTAIIPKNQERIGESFGNFIEQNFLNAELLMVRIREINVAQKASISLQNEKVAARLTQILISIIHVLLPHFNETRTKKYIERVVRDHIKSLNLHTLIRTLISEIPQAVDIEAIVNDLLDLAHTFIHENKHHLEEKVQKKSNWWMPNFIDKRFYTNMMTVLANLIEELRHPGERREHMISALQEHLVKLENNVQMIEKLSEQGHNFISQHLLADTLDYIWTTINHKLSPEASSDVHTFITELIVKTGEKIEHDPLLQENINQVIQDSLKSVLPYRNYLTQFISNVVKEWSAEDISQRIEVSVGRDLQFIRINGALVGGFIGLSIHSLWEVLIHFNIV